MKIISDFHDYYDFREGLISILYGIDPKCVYERKTKEIRVVSFNDIPSYIKNIDKNEAINRLFIHCGVIFKSFNISIDSHLLLFAGKAYPYISVYTFNERLYFYSTQSFLDFIEQSGNDSLKEIYGFKKSKRRYYNSPERNIRRLNRMFDLAKEVNKSDMISNLLREASVPILIISKQGRYAVEKEDINTYFERKMKIEYEIVLNPQLKKIDFQKVIDPYTAFQELSMFICNILGVGENPTVEVSDQSKIEGHGFDKKSFRHPFK
jgi:hypothetical protein